MLANTFFVKSNVIGAYHKVDTRVALPRVVRFSFQFVAIIISPFCHPYLKQNVSPATEAFYLTERYLISSFSNTLLFLSLLISFFQKLKGFSFCFFFGQAARFIHICYTRYLLTVLVFTYTRRSHPLGEKTGKNNTPPVSYYP